MKWATIVAILVLFTSFPIAQALVWETDRMNFPTDQSKQHNQTLTTIGNISVTIPSGFTLVDASGAWIASTEQINWTGINGTVWYLLSSPNASIHGTTYESRIYVDGVYANKFIFLSFDDSLITSYEAQIDHGNFNWDKFEYIGNESTIYFNAFRIFNIGNYLPNIEIGKNASLTCTFPRLPVITLGAEKYETGESSDMTYDDNKTTATFFFKQLRNSLFRIGTLSQKIYNYNVGDTYNVSCGELVYKLPHHTVRAQIPNVSVEIRSIFPFTINKTDSADRVNFIITNSEEYEIRHIVFTWKLANGQYDKKEIEKMNSGDKYSFDVMTSGNGNVSLVIDFVPQWQFNSRIPKIYTQSTDYAFNTGIGTAQILSVVDSIQTTSDNTTGSEVILSDFGSVQSSKPYKAMIFIHDKNGNPTAPDSNPKITIIDPSGNTVSYQINMAQDISKVGVYTYEYNTSSSLTPGVWTSLAEVVVNGQNITRVDYWELGANPPEVNIDIMETKCGEVTCKISITNEGTNSQEYQYRYWTSDKAYGRFGDETMIDSGSDAKLIIPGETFSIEKILSAKSDITQWCNVEVYYGGVEYSKASEQFDGASCGGGATGAVIGPGREYLIPGIDNTSLAILILLLGSIGFLFIFAKKKRNKIIFKEQEEEDEDKNYY